MIGVRLFVREWSPAGILSAANRRPAPELVGKRDRFVDELADLLETLRRHGCTWTRSEVLESLTIRKARLQILAAAGSRASSRSLDFASCLVVWRDV